jgi:hypothetical protein
MSNTTKIVRDDSVTVPEALKRLASQNIKPARQSFYTAVNKGKIREVTDKEKNPDGKRRVSMASVMEYIAGGGFKPHGKSDHAATMESFPPPLVEEPSRRDDLANIAAAKSFEKLPTQIPQSTRQSGQANNHSEPTRHASKPVVQYSDKKVAQRQNEKPQSLPPVMTRTRRKRLMRHLPIKLNSKGNVTLNLRAIKNSLRHLDYEETKAIRDWADNRLLTVLRPTPNAVLNNSESNNQS